MNMISIWDSVKAWFGENTLNIVAIAVLVSVVVVVVLFFTVNPVYNAASYRGTRRRLYYVRRRKKAAKDSLENHSNIWDEMTDNRQ